jgi:hypothetical protein
MYCASASRLYKTDSSLPTTPYRTASLDAIPPRRPHHPPDLPAPADGNWSANVATINEGTCDVHKPCRVLYTAVLVGVSRSIQNPKFGRANSREGQRLQLRDDQGRMDGGLWLREHLYGYFLPSSTHSIFSPMTCATRRRHLQRGGWSSSLHDDPEK